MEEIIYRDNKIVKYGDNDFEVFLIGEYDEIFSVHCSTLEIAKGVIDKHLKFS